MPAWCVCGVDSELILPANQNSGLACMDGLAAETASTAEGQLSSCAPFAGELSAVSSVGMVDAKAFAHAPVRRTRAGAVILAQPDLDLDASVRRRVPCFF